MNISNELLAAYAENNVSPEERQEVRQYLTDHPSELESVMMMMDDDYDLELSTEDTSPNEENLSFGSSYYHNIGTMGHNDDMSFSDIALSAAAFAPQSILMPDCASVGAGLKRESFNDRLDDLIDELGI